MHGVTSDLSCYCGSCCPSIPVHVMFTKSLFYGYFHVIWRVSTRKRIWSRITADWMSRLSHLSIKQCILWLWN